MKITKLALKDYRGCSDLEIEPAPGLTLIVAMNGVGKTTLIAGLAAALGGLACGTFGRPKEEILGRLVRESDHRRIWPSGSDDPLLPQQTARTLIITSTAKAFDIEFSWKVRSERIIGDRLAANSVQLAWDPPAALLRERLQAVSGLPEPLPVLAAVPAYRAPPVDHSKFEIPPLGALESVSPERLLSWTANPLLSVRWQRIRDRWYEVEQRSRLEGNRARNTLTTIVEALRRALELEDEPRFNADYADFMVKLRDGGWRPVSYMSDGWRTYIGTVVAVAMRCAELNPWHPDAAHITPGVLLVDEIEQHLHPRLQLTIIDGLRRAFPELQIIATTHSPLVITDIKTDDMDRVLRLERGPDDTLRVESLHSPAGCDAVDILTGAWFGLASTLDDETLKLMAQHRALMRKDPAERDKRKALEEVLRRRIHRYAETSVEEFVLSVVAELETEPAFEALSHTQMRELRNQVLDRIKAGLP
jgi:predicted ATP-binding protein involved in virulence